MVYRNLNVTLAYLLRPKNPEEDNQKKKTRTAVTCVRPSNFALICGAYFSVHLFRTDLIKIAQQTAFNLTPLQITYHSYAAVAAA